MKKKVKKEEKKQLGKQEIWNIFLTLFFSVFVFLRFIVDGITYPFFNFYWNIFFIFIFILYISLKKFRFEIEKFNLIFLLFILFSFISTGISEIRGTGINLNSQFLSYWCFLIIILQNFKVKNSKILLYSLLASGFFVTIYGIYQYFWGFEITRNFLLSHPEIAKNLPPTFIDRMMSQRVFSTFVYPNIFASFLITLIPLSFFLFLAGENIYEKTTGCILLSLSFYNLFLTGSIGGIAISLFVLHIILLFLIFKNKKIFITVFSILFIFEISVFIAGYRTGKLPHIHSFLDRVRYWKSAVKVFEEKPIMGVGSENYKFYYLKYKEPESMEAKHAHSLFFETLAENGIAGTVLLFSFLIYLLFFIFKLGENNYFVYGIGFSLLSFFLHNMADFDFADPSVGILFFLLPSIALLIVRNHKIPSLKLTKTFTGLIIIMIVFNLYGYVRYNLCVKNVRYSSQAGDLKSKLYFLNEAEKFYPENFEIYYEKGRIFEKLGEYEREYIEKAIISYLTTVKLNPYYTKGYRNLARLYLKEGKVEEAEKAYIKLLQIYPVKKEYNLEVALFYKKIGDEKNFKYYYQKSKKLKAVTIEEKKNIEEMGKWIELQK